MKITVFGGSQPKPGGKAYRDAVHLGRLLGAGGHTVLTGGYTGTMEAVSRGAAESGGHVIGVTCQEIENYRPSGPNRWVMEEKRTTTLTERIGIMIQTCDAVLALPGGPGTLTEISLLWNQMIIGAAPLKPLILIGRGWRVTYAQLFRSLDRYFLPRDRDLLTFVPDADSAYRALTLHLEPGR